MIIVVLCTCCCGSPADIDGDGRVDGRDLTILLEQWGSTGIADIDSSGVVDSTDLGIMLREWS